MIMTVSAVTMLITMAMAWHSTRFVCIPEFTGHCKDMYMHTYAPYIHGGVYFVSVNTNMKNRGTGMTFSFSLLGGVYSGPWAPMRAQHMKARPIRPGPLGPGLLGPR